MPGLSKEFAKLRDEIFDEAVYRQRITAAQAINSAFVLLSYNYNLAASSAALIVQNADPNELAKAVYNAYFQHASDKISYTEWARTGLIANNIDPDNLDPGIISTVLDHLELTNRIAPKHKLTHSGLARSYRESLPS
jgi:hypothetical protein